MDIQQTAIEENKKTIKPWHITVASVLTVGILGGVFVAFEQTRQNNEAALQAHLVIESIPLSAVPSPIEIIEDIIDGIEDLLNLTEEVPFEDHPFFEAEMPILVNREHFIPDDWDADLVPIENGFYLNRRAAAAWQEMRATAEEDGIELRVISAYRSHERQQRNFNNMVQRHIDAGRTAEEAHAMTAAYIAIPGTCEHTLGLAIDINSLYTSFEHTAEFAWLLENCARFGFILRYPRGKTDITFINFEPWHYRYVGINHATIMMEEGITLEEYLMDNV